MSIFKLLNSRKNNNPFLSRTRFIMTWQWLVINIFVTLFSYFTYLQTLTYLCTIIFKKLFTEMETPIKIGFDLDLIAETFNIQRKEHCLQLQNWLSANYKLDQDEQKIFDRIASDMEEDGDYWNEEELKIQAVGFLFYIANIKVKGQIKVFYERPMSALINGYQLAVISDCMVATPRSFSTPRHPYFFLQEFKKGKGKKKTQKLKCFLLCLLPSTSIMTTNLFTVVIWLVVLGVLQF